MSRLSIGIVGAGEITRKLHLPVLLNMPDVEVAWLCDSRQSQATMVGKAYGVKSVFVAQPEALPACDVALLAIPVEARSEYLSLFSRRNTAVLCEKPFAASAADHRRMIETFPSHRLGSGYQRRFYRSTILLREILARGWFGPLRSISLSEGDRSRGSGVDHSFLDDGQSLSTRGVLFDLGTHGIDLATHLTSAESFRVLTSEVIFDGPVDRKVTAEIALQGSNTAGAGPVAFSYCVSWLDRQSNIIRLDFERATVWSALSPSGEVFLGDPNRPQECVTLAGPAGATTPNQAFYLEWRAFITGVRAQTDSPIAARSALLTTALMEELLSLGRATRG
jgi:predicted dehydrogenase